MQLLGRQTLRVPAHPIQPPQSERDSRMETTHHDYRTKEDSILPPVIRGLQRVLAEALLRPPEGMQIDPRM